MVEQSPDSFERRLLAVLEPDAATIQRVKTRATARAAKHRSHRSLVLAVAALATLVAVGYFVWRHPAGGVETVTILQSADDLVLVQTSDGQQWLLGPSSHTTAPGTMELVIEGGK